MLYHWMGGNGKEKVLNGVLMTKLLVLINKHWGKGLVSSMKYFLENITKLFLLVQCCLTHGQEIVVVSVLICIMSNKKCFSLTPKPVLISLSCFWNESETIPWVLCTLDLTQMWFSFFFFSWSFPLPPVYRRENFFLVKNEPTHLRTRVCVSTILLGQALVSLSFISSIALSSMLKYT